MLTLLRHKRLLWPTVMTLAGVLLGLSLGMWQLQRRTWKAGLIQRIESRAKALPVTLDQAMQVWAETRDVEYLHVRLTGRFHHDKERFLQAVEKGVAGCETNFRVNAEKILQEIKCQWVDVRHFTFEVEPDVIVGAQTNKPEYFFFLVKLLAIRYLFFKRTVKREKGVIGMVSVWFAC